MQKMLLIAMCIAVSVGLCSCRDSQTQRISDVTRPQRLVFHSPKSGPSAVDFHVLGQVDGNAVIASVEAAEPQKEPWPTQKISGAVDCRVRQAWSSQTCTMDYTPADVRAGHLTIKLSWH